MVVHLVVARVVVERVVVSALVSERVVVTVYVVVVSSNVDLMQRLRLLELDVQHLEIHDRHHSFFQFSDSTYSLWVMVRYGYSGPNC